MTVVLFVRWKLLHRGTGQRDCRSDLRFTKVVLTKRINRGVVRGGWEFPLYRFCGIIHCNRHQAIREPGFRPAQPKSVLSGVAGVPDNDLR